MTQEMMKLESTKRIDLIGRRWFNHTSGNTYHSVEISVNGKHVHTIPYAYGYDNDYVDTAATWLHDNGLIKLERHGNGIWQSLWRHCDESNIEYGTIVFDVKRKKDL